MRLCPDCLSEFKRSALGHTKKAARGTYGDRVWPDELYHSQVTRKCKKHHAQSLADSAARRAGLSKATPKWADRTAIQRIYSECLSASKRTGIRHEVDHIVPLNGRLVSGLHVHWNLQVIPASENRFKSNKF